MLYNRIWHVANFINSQYSVYENAIGVKNALNVSMETKKIYKPI